MGTTIAIMDGSVPIIQPSKKIKLAAVAGEWWIQNGQAEFADQDVADYGHEAAVIDYVRSNYGYFDDTGTWEEYIMKKGEEYLLEKIEQSPEMRDQARMEFSNDPMPVIKEYFEREGMSDEEWLVANDMADGREYAMRELGWIRVAGRSIQMHSLAGDMLSSLVRGLEDIFDQTGTEEGMEGEFDIELTSARKFFTNIDYDTIRSIRRTGDVSELLRHQHRGWS